MNESPRPVPGSPAAAVGSRQLDALTGIRLFGALHVVLFHFGDRVFRELAAVTGSSTSDAWWIALENMRRAGVPSVTMFFMMSGFILAYKYMDPAGERRLDLRYFLVARLSRFYPIYLAALLLMVPFIRFTPVGASPRTAAVSGTLQVLGLQAWVPQYVLTWNNPGWTLSIDLFFYLLFPTLVIPLFQKRTGRQLLAIAGGLWAASLAASIAYVVLAPDGVPVNYRTEAFWLNVVKFNPAVRLPEILIGAVAGLLFLRDEAAGRRRRGALYSVLGLLVVFAVAAVSGRIHFALIHNGLMAPVLAAILFGLAHGGGPVSWLFSRRPIVFLGDAAFAMYILQWPVMAWTIFLTGRPFHESTFSAPFLGGYLATLVALSCIGFLVLERPAQRWLRRWLLRGVPAWKPAAAKTAAALPVPAPAPAAMPAGAQRIAPSAD